MIHLLALLFQGVAHAQMIIPGLDSIAGDAATDAAVSGGLAAATGGASLALPVIGGAIGGVASGLLGMLGGQQQNAANEQEQAQAEQYNTQMSDTQYQRTVADMKAAGINPMFLAMGAGTDNSPTAPMYTNVNTLSNFAASASDMGDLYDKYQQAQKNQADITVKQAEAGIAGQKAQADLDNAQATALKAGVAAQVATQTQDAQINTANAQSSKAQADAKTAGVTADWANTDEWMKNISSGANSAEKVLEGVGIGKWLRSGLNPAPNTYNPKTTGTFNKQTGEIHE